MVQRRRCAARKRSQNLQSPQLEQDQNKGANANRCAMQGALHELPGPEAVAGTVHGGRRQPARGGGQGARHRDVVRLTTLSRHTLPTENLLEDIAGLLRLPWDGGRVVDAAHHRLLGCGKLLHSRSAQVHAADDVITSEGPRSLRY